MRVVHMTSAHARNDVRIFLKECRSLAVLHDVTLVVADGLGPETCDSVKVIDAGRRPRSRIVRMAFTPWRVLAVAPVADLYHLHDPELIPIGLELKRRGKTVIFDAHEDLPAQLLSKPYLPRSWRPLLATLAHAGLLLAARRFDGIIAATPGVAERFRRAGIAATVVRNFPLRDEIRPAPWDSKEALACYIGLSASARGSNELAAVADQLNHGRIMVGGGGTAPVGVECLGFLDREGVQHLLDCARVGIVCLHPTPAYTTALPVKLFEYMAAGIPVVASDFPLWRQIVTEAGCGLLVDPLDAKAIAAAIDFLLANPDQAEMMGRNGRAAVEHRYSWTAEARTLRETYAAIHQATLAIAA